MKKSRSELGKIKLIGITARTRNAFEMDPKKAKISSTLNRYFGNNLAAEIPNRIKPGITYCVYTDFESDEKGEYTYFVGEEVDSFDGIGVDFQTLIIPASSYTKFEIGAGVMPDICIDAWKKIWQMKSEDFHGKRSFIADFEIYDQRAKDPQNTVFDIYIGVKDR